MLGGATMVAILIGACAGDGRRGQPADGRAAARIAVDANSAFAWDLLREVGRQKPGENIFFSPWSIGSALAMTLEGARGETALEMGKVLQLPAQLRQESQRPWKLEPLHAGFAELQRRCTGPRDEAKD
jgi:hypothetical protein